MSIMNVFLRECGLFIIIVVISILVGKIIVS